jgi:hypothetical protein
MSIVGLVAALYYQMDDDSDNNIVLAKLVFSVHYIGYVFLWLKTGGGLNSEMSCLSQNVDNKQRPRK